MSRRSVIRGAGCIGASLTLLGCGSRSGRADDAEDGPYRRTDEGLFITNESERALLSAKVNSRWMDPDEPINSYRAITNYNNFYEFGVDKSAPARYADAMKTDPWVVTVDGDVETPRTYGFEDLVDLSQLEQRIYRLRCVEAWSMVVPWIGVPLRAVIEKLKPLSSAQYVRFETLHRPKEMVGQRGRVLDWPYTEALRMDEAMNELAFIAVGLYGRVLPNQNGAPMRLVLPWKYGFKSIKSIASISFTSKKPRTSWNKSSPREYGFYANVNPDVSHPRWSQAKERRIGEFRRRDTLPFNGYADQVASLYSGMNLKRNF